MKTSRNEKYLNLRLIYSYTTSGHPEILVGSKSVVSAFFVVDSNASYNALLGRDWIHSAKCMPSSMHQAMKIWGDAGVEVVKADPSPFIAKMHAAEAFYYIEGIGPHRFLGINKFGYPPQ